MNQPWKCPSDLVSDRWDRLLETKSGKGEQTGRKRDTGGQPDFNFFSEYSYFVCGRNACIPFPSPHSFFYLVHMPKAQVPCIQVKNVGKGKGGWLAEVNWSPVLTQGTHKLCFHPPCMGEPVIAELWGLGSNSQDVGSQGRNLPSFCSGVQGILWNHRTTESLRLERPPRSSTFDKHHIC